MMVQNEIISYIYSFVDQINALASNTKKEIGIRDFNGILGSEMNGNLVISTDDTCADIVEFSTKTSLFGSKIYKLSQYTTNEPDKKRTLHLEKRSNTSKLVFIHNGKEDDITWRNVGPLFAHCARAMHHVNPTKTIVISTNILCAMISEICNTSCKTGLTKVIKNEYNPQLQTVSQKIPKNALFPGVKLISQVTSEDTYCNEVRILDDNNRPSYTLLEEITWGKGSQLHIGIWKNNQCTWVPQNEMFGVINRLQPEILLLHVWKHVLQLQNNKIRTSDAIHDYKNENILNTDSPSI